MTQSRRGTAMNEEENGKKRKINEVAGPSKPQNPKAICLILPSQPPQKKPNPQLLTPDITPAKDLAALNTKIDITMNDSVNKWINFSHNRFASLDCSETSEDADSSIDLNTQEPPTLPNPRTHIGKPVSQHIDKMQWKKWTEKPQLKVWVRTWRARWIESSMANVRDKITKTLTSFLGTSSVFLSNPIPDSNMLRDKYNPPWHFLLYNLSDKEYELITNIQVITSKTVMIFILPFHQPIPSYLISIEDTTCRKDDQGLKAITQAIIRSF
ncbi:hypothetical protein P691DRAFT_790650 [Macrolepiota fuliginosa MF-IS2]|uniref:Uncharacterized protein n=1 Tax=Macrolepiota fuliginosa MF-IS2 TaxID=1400762 RepID=A0A9P5X065_9AGAR|nr:hypothetical protein P691DRAFT_790650 [Macrolepiota fuliginosa MF-IS2]